MLNARKWALWTLVFVFGLSFIPAIPHSAGIPLPPLVHADGPAQDDAVCTELVQTAYDLTQEACSGTGRDQACYGNTLLQAQPDGLTFEQTGDTVNLAELEGLRLSSMDTETGDWGISLMHIRASLPDNSSQNVELVLFGNVEIENAGGEAFSQGVFIEIIAPDNVNVRGGPSTNDERIGSITGNTPIIADGRSEAGDWLRVILSEEGVEPIEYGWVSAQFFSAVAGDDFATLPVVDAANAEPTASYGPMQAFYFTSGADDRPCEAAPDSGIMIQTPEGEGTISLLINEVAIDLGSTAYFQAQPSGFMTVYVVEGQATATAFGGTVIAPAGTRLRVPLDANGAASGVPIGPEPYGGTDLQPLPVSLVSQPISVAPSLTEEEIVAQVGTPRSGVWQLIAWDSDTPTPCNEGSGFSNRVFGEWTMAFTFDEDGSMTMYFGVNEDGSLNFPTPSARQSGNVFVTSVPLSSGSANVMTHQFLTPELMRVDVVYDDACPATNGFTAQWIGPLE